MLNVDIYTDGSCLGNGKANAKGGFGALVSIDKSEELLAIYGGFPNTTNNEMELEACIQALDAIPPNVRAKCNIRLFSDSAYLVNCMNEKWHEKWVQNKWRKSNKKPVLNVSQWKEILNLSSQYNAIEFIKVAGHSDNEFNNKADKLAVKGSKSAIGKVIQLKGKLEEL